VNGQEDGKDGGTGSATRIVASHDGQGPRTSWVGGVLLILVTVDGEQHR
jgi:hypothetical protein